MAGSNQQYDKTFSAIQADRIVASGNAIFAELVKVFQRDIDPSKSEESLGTKLIGQNVNSNTTMFDCVNCVMRVSLRNP